MHGQYVIKHLPAKITERAFYIRRNLLNFYTGKSRSKASLYRWHQRLGHIGPEPLKRLLSHTEGVTITSRPTHTRIQIAIVLSAPQQHQRATHTRACRAP
ncbi:hypothetical protein F5Y03DRAFT_377927 [Xylaria venustula]|nr:hypothetical protein F5Y03DRAFT_377927 [Xylaria venustula]